MSASEVHNGMVDMKPSVKLCVNCKHHARPEKEGMFDRCTSPNDLVPSVIDGIPRPKIVYCHVLRSIEGFYCGTEGKWFEPRASEPQDFARDHGVNVGEVA